MNHLLLGNFFRSDKENHGKVLTCSPRRCSDYPVYLLARLLLSCATRGCQAGVEGVRRRRRLRRLAGRRGRRWCGGRGGIHSMRTTRGL
jgi:hypothetical protein